MVTSLTALMASGDGAMLIAAGAAIAALICAGIGLARARAAGESARLCAARIATLEEALNEATDRLRALALEQALPARPALREAVALSRRGAHVEEIMTTCRIGQGEARLIQMLYGMQRPGAAPPCDGTAQSMLA